MKKSNIFSIIIFFIVSIFISLLFNSIESTYEIAQENNSLHTNNAFQVQISKNNIPSKGFYHVISNINNIYLEKDNVSLGNYFGKAMYFNGKLKSEPPMVEGDFLRKKDFNAENKYCVIGKKLKDLIRYKDGKGYISIDGNDYLVIGIMGKNNRSSAFDETFYVNFNATIPVDNSSWIIDGEDSSETYGTLKSSLVKLDKDIIITNSSLDELRSSFSSILSDRFYIIIITALVILTLMLNIINTTNLYINNRKKEFGVRRTFGATKLQVYKRIIIDYQLMAISAFIISQITYILIIKFKMLPFVFGEKILIKSTTYSFIVLLIVGTLVSIIPIIKSNKFEPNEVMKGL